MAASMEDFVSNVRSYSSQGQLSQLCEFMNKSWGLLVKNLTHLDSALEALDIQENSLGVLYILCVKVSLIQTTYSSNGDFEQVFFQVQLFVSQCIKEQLQYSTGNFTQMCHTIVQELCKRKIAIRGIKLIGLAIEKVQADTGQLTSLHADLCQLCLDAKCIKPALPFLNVEVSDIGKENGCFESKHFLSYYYYRGMIFTALKQFEDAIFSFEQALTCPAQVMSHIMLESYKKYVLVCLIHEGRVRPLPKYTSQVLTRFVKMFNVEYSDLEAAYATNKPAKLHAAVTNHSATFTADRNVGLVKQVVFSNKKRNIQRLTQTFITLSLSDVATRTFLSGPEEAELQLRKMIEKREIFACIDQERMMVSFYDNPEKYDSGAMVRKIDSHVQEFISLDRRLTSMDQELQVNPMFVQKVKNVSTQDEDFEGSILSSSASSSSQSSRSASILSKLMFR